MARIGVIAALIPALMGAGLPASRVTVVVVTESTVDAYSEAVEGIAAVLPSGSYRTIDLAAKTGERDLAAAGLEGVIVIAVGSRALAGVRARHLPGRIVAAMSMPGAEAEPNTRRVGLGVPPPLEFAAMRALWPGKTRAAIIRNPHSARSELDMLQSCARKEGFTLLEAYCDGPAQLLKTLATLKGKADFVLCFPDAELYNAATIKPLVLASLEERLPLVGFSPTFVRAGAAAGIYPDYREIGRQSAEMVLRMLRGEERDDEESPRKIRVAINQRVTRLMGVEFRGAAVAAEVYR